MIWWLSYATRERCAGVCVVQARDFLAAASRVRELGIVPVPFDQVLGGRVPPEHEARCLPLLGRCLSEGEARELLGARSLGELEAEGSS